MRARSNSPIHRPAEEVAKAAALGPTQPLAEPIACSGGAPSNPNAQNIRLWFPSDGSQIAGQHVWVFDRAVMMDLAPAVGGPAE
jgi:hypothetical protein